MKIHILCHDGSPLGVTSNTIYGDRFRVGVGGAELALLTLAELWSKDHEVVLYNNPWEHNPKIDQRKIPDFQPAEDRDILIVFRSPNPASYRAKGKKIWWSCDQATVGDFRSFGNTVSKIVTISPRHHDYFKEHYNLDSVTIPLPVRLWDYDKEVKRVNNRLLFSSVPARGLDILAQVYPSIKKQVPDVSLVITSDYRLWGADAGNHQYRQQFMHMKDVQFKGALNRNLFNYEQLAADVLAYPCTYDELFCIAVSEAQVSGAYPITSDVGAVETTNLFGTQIPGNPNDINWRQEYVRQVVDYLCKPPEEKDAIRKNMMKQASEEAFNPEKILEQWDELVFNE